MIILSLFDGMSCGQIALNQANIKIDKYYACEIKPHAIKVTQHNFPNTIQLGDVRNVSPLTMEKIDIVIGGSPCQDFSRGNLNRTGLEGFKSSLFYEYVRILNEAKLKNPDVKFLLENVVMPINDESVINDVFDMVPLRINSSLVSAQLRDRLYWTNIGENYSDLFGRKYSSIPQPNDKKILLKDILESGYTDREKSRALLESDSRPLKSQKKMWHRYKNTGFTTIVFEDESLNWEKGIRYLSQTELERLQTVPEGYTSILNRNNAACLLGDGWTVDVISHIFSYM